MKSDFVHLHTHTHFSLLDGLGKIDELIEKAKEYKMKALAITDHGVLYGAIEFYKKARHAGIKPIIGVEAYISIDHKSKTLPEDRIRRHIILLAKNLEGYKNLLKLISIAHLEGYYYKPRIDKKLLAKHYKGLIALSGCLNGEIPKLIITGNLKEAENIAKEYKKIFGPDNFYFEIQIHKELKDQEIINKELKKLSKKLDIPLVATIDTHYPNKEDRKAQDVLVSINTNKDFSDDNRFSMAKVDLSFKNGIEAEEMFKDYPEAIKNTLLIADKCNLELELNKIELPLFPLPKGKDHNKYLEKLTWNGVEKRYGKQGLKDKEIYNRVKYELKVIEKMGFASYFLIVWDFVNWAKRKSILVGPGRGSASGSIVSYCLNITSIDPIKYKLMFERFLNPDRISMPDIDLDFDDMRRNEVIEYTKKKYGKDKVAQVITFGTMASRGAIRDVGRVLNYPYNYCDKLAKIIPFNMSLDQALREIKEFQGIYNNDKKGKELINIARRLEGVARHTSTHACAVVITNKPLIEYTPLQYASSGDETIITQFEMHAIEDLGLLKMDFLGLKNLTIISNALKLIQERKKILINIENIPLNDKKTFKLLQEGKTTGVFQFESEGMKKYLKDLKPTEIEDLIIMVSLYRPGPMELIPSYIRRKHKKEKVKYIHPKMEPALKNTYGIMVYQEQLMQIARDLSGFTLAEADILRKAVGKKIKSLLNEQKEKFIQGAIKNDVSLKIATTVWKLVEPFSQYAFNRSHAASYAMIGYQTAYLKANFSTEFITALLNSRQGDLERLTFFVEEARNMDIKILPPDINESGLDFTIINDKSIRFGMRAIKNVGSNIVQNILEERIKKGKFKDIKDFINRVKDRAINKKTMEALIKTGVFDTIDERGCLIYNLEFILLAAQELRAKQNTIQGGLFDNAGTGLTLNLQNAKPASLEQKLLWERELLGLYISGNPLEKHKKLFTTKLTPIKNIIPSANNKSLWTGGTIEKVKKINTKSGNAMLFVKIKDLENTLEVTVFPRILERYPIWQEGTPIAIKGKAQIRNNELNFLCEQIKKLS